MGFFFFSLGAEQAPEATVVFVPFWMRPWFGRRPASYLTLTVRKTVHADEFREEALALFVWEQLSNPFNKQKLGFWRTPFFCLQALKRGFVDAPHSKASIFIFFYEG